GHRRSPLAPSLFTVVRRRSSRTTRGLPAMGRRLARATRGENPAARALERPCTAEGWRDRGRQGGQRESPSMATDQPEFYQAPKFSAEYDELRPKQRGCFFYGCVIASVLTVLLILALAVGAYMVYRALNRYLEEYTSTAPRELPKVKLTEDERKSVVDRFEAFRKAIKDQTATEPLVLTGDDLHALVESVPELKDGV